MEPPFTGEGDSVETLGFILGVRGEWGKFCHEGSFGRSRPGELMRLELVRLRFV